MVLRPAACWRLALTTAAFGSAMGFRVGSRRPEQHLEGRSAFEAFFECVQPGKGPALSTAAVAAALLIASGQRSRKLACDFCQIPEGGARSRVGTLARQADEAVLRRLAAQASRGVDAAASACSGARQTGQAETPGGQADGDAAECRAPGQAPPEGQGDRELRALAAAHTAGPRCAAARYSRWWLRALDVCGGCDAVRGDQECPLPPPWHQPRAPAPGAQGAQHPTPSRPHTHFRPHRDPHSQSQVLEVKTCIRNASFNSLKVDRAKTIAKLPPERQAWLQKELRRWPQLLDHNLDLLAKLADPECPGSNEHTVRLNGRWEPVNLLWPTTSA